MQKEEQSEHSFIKIWIEFMFHVRGFHIGLWLLIRADVHALHKDSCI